MTNNTKHAVLSNVQLWTRTNDGAWMRETLTPGSLTGIADVAIARHITHVWILPECGDFEQQKSAGAYTIQINERHDKMVAVSIWKRGAGHVNIIFAGNTIWWGDVAEPLWMQRAAFCPSEIIATIMFVERALGVPFTASAGGIGWSYLKTLHPEWVEEIPGVDLKECHFDKHAGPDIIWQSPYLAMYIQAGALYVHKFDKGSAYPAASTMTDIGVGTPVHVDHGRDTEKLDKIGNFRKVGVWNCHVTSMAIHDIMPPAHIASGQYWLAGPRINMLRAAGYSVEAFEGYVFPEQHDVLTLWAKNLWDIRQGFDGTNDANVKTWGDVACMGYAREAIKLIANATIGFTAFKGFEDEDNEKKRPDIRLQVIARHTEIMRANIAKVKAMYGAAPVMVYMDAVYYLSDNPDGRAAFPELVKREGKLGGFKYEGRVAITDQVRDMFLSKKNVATRLEALNKIGWTK